MKVCYFGTYENNYPRNRIIIDGLRKNGVEVIECHSDLWKLEQDKTKFIKLALTFPIIFLKLAYAYAVLLYKYFLMGGYRCQTIMVGYPGHADIFLAYLLSLLGRKYLVFNPLISIYDALINDRKLIKESSTLAKIILLLEKITFRLPNIILLDTSAHISLVRQILDIPAAKKIVRVFVGADEKSFPFKGYSASKKTLQVSFIGKFTPLHGLPVIIQAVKLLEKYRNIHFTIVGKGQLSDDIDRLKKNLKIKNVKFMSWVPYRELAQIISNSDVCLGIFDKGKKAQSVIPNKIYEAIAMGKAVITANSPAINELFEDNKNIVLSAPNNPHSLAEKILLLQSNPKLLKKIASEAHKLFEQKLTEEKIGKKVKDVLESFCQR